MYEARVYDRESSMERHGDRALSSSTFELSVVAKLGSGISKPSSEGIPELQGKNETHVSRIDSELGRFQDPIETRSRVPTHSSACHVAVQNTDPSSESARDLFNHSQTTTGRRCSSRFRSSRGSRSSCATNSARQLESPPFCTREQVSHKERERERERTRLRRLSSATRARLESLFLSLSLART